MYINNLLLFHGYSAFSLNIIEYIDISNLSKKEIWDIILSKEQSYLNLINPKYNILKFAGSSLGILTHDNNLFLKLVEKITIFLEKFILLI